MRQIYPLTSVAIECFRSADASSLTGRRWCLGRVRSIEAQGKIVTKNQIFERVWQDMVVEENNIQVQISALRRALGDDRDFILTVPLRGYRLVAKITST
jgi:hypothetical protein